MVSCSFTGRWPLQAYWLDPALWGGKSREPAFLYLLGYLHSHDFIHAHFPGILSELGALLQWFVVVFFFYACFKQFWYTSGTC